MILPFYTVFQDPYMINHTLKGIIFLENNILFYWQQEEQLEKEKAELEASKLAAEVSATENVDDSASSTMDSNVKEGGVAGGSKPIPSKASMKKGGGKGKESPSPTKKASNKSPSPTKKGWLFTILLMSRLMLLIFRWAFLMYFYSRRCH